MKYAKEAMKSAMSLGSSITATELVIDCRLFGVPLAFAHNKLVEVQVDGNTHGSIVAGLLALSAPRNDTLGIRTPSSDDTRQTTAFYTFYCGAICLVERVRSDTTAAC